jgi:RpiR family carbohydrate utilization transcriptional regulator
VDNAVAAFLQYRNAASTAAIEQAAQAIASTWQTGRRIEFYGAGNSGIVAQDAQHKFFRLGVTSLATSDGHMQVMSATLLGPGDCAVIISNSDRYSPMVSRLLHLLVIDVLATCVALRIGPALQPALEQMKNNLRAKRYT